MYDYLDIRLTRLEARFGLKPTAVLIGLGLFLVACIYVRPGYQTATGLGHHYAELARHPFGTGAPNKVGFRFLTPLLSYLVGLRGGLVVVTNLIIAALFIMAVYWCYRRLSPRPADALIASSIIAFSLVTLTTIYYSGFCDALTYVIIFFMWWWRRKPWLFWILFVLGVFNRESIVFLIPWFLFIRCEGHHSPVRRLSLDLVAVAMVGLIVWQVRAWQSSHMKIGFDAAYYLEPLRSDPLFYFRRSSLHSLLGFTTVFKLLWAVPVVAAVYLWRQKKTADLAALIILLVCSAAQLLIAWDSSRLWTMAFMTVMIALVHLFQSTDTKYRHWILPLILVNFLVPQDYTAAHIIEYMRSLPDTIVRLLFWDKGW
ncbi:MAG: hypothetical protein AB1644_04900 [Candidatus Zixiibacteriota bacterium]